jgi:hypothetical protein
VFAVREIPQGRNPFPTLPKYGAVGYVRNAAEQLDALPSKLSGLIRAPFILIDGTMYLPNHGMNIVRLNSCLNNSTKPNMRTRDGYDFVRNWTVDYRTYGAESHVTMQ